MVGQPLGGPEGRKRAHIGQTRDISEPQQPSGEPKPDPSAVHGGREDGQYDHFTGGRFRHGAKFLRWRPEKKPESCLLAQAA